MIELLGSLLGFGTSFLPSIVEYFKESRDRKHELVVMDKQMAMMKAEAGTRIEEASLQVDARSEEWARKAAIQEVKRSSRWVANLCATVRPVITYCFFFAYIAFSFVLFSGSDPALYERVWNEETRAIWAAIISYWFGSRTFNRKRHS